MESHRLGLYLAILILGSMAPEKAGAQILGHSTSAIATKTGTGGFAGGFVIAGPTGAAGGAVACPSPNPYPFPFPIWISSFGTPYDPWFRPTYGPPHPPVILITSPMSGPSLPPMPGTPGAPRATPPNFQPKTREQARPTRLPPEQAQVRRARPSESPKTQQLLTLGDRLFRAGNRRRASERYVQAFHSAPHSAAPRVRLAQLAVVRGQYAEAANLFREAQAAEPDWLVHAPDIQSIYGEPSDFSEPIARLETHLQVHPNDRDAWLVLGAQWYLSGRTRRAADIFVRLSDRPADPTLDAFLAATSSPEDRAKR